MSLDEGVGLEDGGEEEEDAVVDEEDGEPGEHHGVGEFPVSGVQEFPVLHFLNIRVFQLNQVLDFLSGNLNPPIQFCHVKN